MWSNPIQEEPGLNEICHNTDLVRSSVGVAASVGVRIEIGVINI